METIAVTLYSKDNSITASTYSERLVRESKDTFRSSSPVVAKTAGGCLIAPYPAQFPYAGFAYYKPSNVPYTVIDGPARRKKELVMVTDAEGMELFNGTFPDFLKACSLQSIPPRVVEAYQEGKFSGQTPRLETANKETPLIELYAKDGLSIFMTEKGNGWHSYKTHTDSASTRIRPEGGCLFTPYPTSYPFAGIAFYDPSSMPPAIFDGESRRMEPFVEVTGKDGNVWFQASFQKLLLVLFLARMSQKKKAANEKGVVLDL